MLFDSLKLNDQLTLKNRIVMAPLTRCFADEHLVPTQNIVDYYSKRADAGLIISEATIVHPRAQGYPNTPGIYTPEQIKGWKKVTQAVHDKGGKMFSQLWHTGRVAHSFYSGQIPIAPSAIALEDRVPRTEDLRYETPQEATLEDIEHIKQQFVQAALNAKSAGFDGVEIHGANGYLIDQFLHQHTNRRQDEYGGSPEKLSRFALEVVDEVCQAIGPESVGLRLSPAAHYNMQHVDGDEKTFAYLLGKLNHMSLAYIHVGMFDDSATFNALGGRASEFIRNFYNGSLLGCGSYTVEKATKEIIEKKIDFVAFGRPFIANADLVQKIRREDSLTEYNDAMLMQL